MQLSPRSTSSIVAQHVTEPASGLWNGLGAYRSSCETGIGTLLPRYGREGPAGTISEDHLLSTCSLPCLSTNMVVGAASISNFIWAHQELTIICLVEESLPQTMKSWCETSPPCTVQLSNLSEETLSWRNRELQRLKKKVKNRRRLKKSDLKNNRFSINYFQVQTFVKKT